MPSFIKWVGSKRKLAKKLNEFLPPGVENMRHVEPFAGSAALFFERRPKRALLADSNEDLMLTYRVVRDDVDELVRHVRYLESQFKSCGIAGSARHYYSVRETFNDHSCKGISRAAQFIYLNKTCFNGVWRVNSTGDFNVPIGDYDSPVICDEETLRECSALLQGVSFSSSSFDDLLSSLIMDLEVERSPTFVYLDPPYIPASETANFTAYTKAGFSLEDHRRLRDFAIELSTRGAHVMLSNSHTPLALTLYQDTGWRIDVVRSPRSLNSDARKRGAVGEIVVRSWLRAEEAKECAQ